MAEPCGAKTKSGGRCKQLAMDGQRRCYIHGGKSPQALAKAQERLAVARATKVLADLGEPLAYISPYDSLEQLNSQSMALVEILRGEVSRLQRVSYEGVVAEQIQGEIAAYLAAMTRAESISAKIISLGLEERKLLRGVQGVDATVQAVDAVLNSRELMLSSDQVRWAEAEIARRFRAHGAEIVDGSAEDVG